GGPSARREGDGLPRTPHSGRHGQGVLPQRASLARDGRGRGQGAGGSLTGIRRGRARARTHAYRRRDGGTHSGVMGTKKGSLRAALFLCAALRVFFAFFAVTSF